jgi:predicted RecA/RadA family phage recombinase
MATNEIYKDADSVPYPVAAAVVSGNLVVFASGLVGVAEVSAKANEQANGFVATIRTQGIWSVPMPSGAIVVGTAIYASSTASAGVGVVGTATATATANTLVGTVYRGKPAAAGNIYIRIGA